MCMCACSEKWQGEIMVFCGSKVFAFRTLFNLIEFVEFNLFNMYLKEVMEVRLP